jgi:SAM-dependent methyltransferase
MLGQDKVRVLTAGRDLAASVGVEIGPRDAPLITRAQGRVLYADYANTATILATLDASLDPANVVEVDIVTGGGSLSAVMTEQVDYVVASHVAEHVPDLLGWLADLHAVLKPGGTVGLAIPDRRFIFDWHRNESIISEAVEAYVCGYSRPSVRQIFDSAWQSVTMAVEDGWRAGPPDKAEDLQHRLEKLPRALQLVQDVHASGRYNNAHCWVFTPKSFLDLCDHADRMALLPFELEVFHPTEQGGYEFYVVFRRAEGGQAGTSIEQARAVLAAWPAERVFAEAHVSDEVRALRTENAALRDSLHVMRHSRFWRLTAPLRRLVELVRPQGLP